MIDDQIFQRLLDEGGPVHPSTTTYDDGSTQSYVGMTLRDYFAAQALPAAVEILSTAPGWSEYAAALQAYKLADAMLKVRSK